MHHQIEQRLAEVNDRIERALNRAGRKPGSVTLIGVTKTLSAETVVQGVESGLVHLGENRFQEVPDKQDALRQMLGGERYKDLIWHFIGQLQSNKVRPVLQRFRYIHSVDRLKLVRRINRTAGELGIVADTLIQLNVSGADTQGGVAPEKVDELLEEAAGLENLRIHGLMAIGPITEDESELHRAFEKVRNVAVRASSMRLDGITMEMLSMGMSGDFEVAVEEGATHVRVGSAIFGSRRTA
jgi:pyridoxal phosphate enzyme (YggS family)